MSLQVKPGQDAGPRQPGHPAESSFDLHELLGHAVDNWFLEQYQRLTNVLFIVSLKLGQD